ncbi:conjugal transfer protein TraN [Campylobacter fetus]|uniref:conjugal transfer protein TraN n=1 Tax=Campylobacter fetus TaxID=196 RepID=UPI000AE00A5C|nr:conjugal transfer protein TraN [Campylobacter fetus]
MINNFIKAISIATILYTSSNAAIVCDDFSEFKEYGGHYYTITANRMSFTQAMKAATSAGGYIAIPDSAAENSFLAKNYPNSWIGIYDPQYTQNSCIGTACGKFDASRFKTVKNVAPTYTNWHTTEPNNLIKPTDVDNNGVARVSPLGEHWVIIGRNGTWGDEGNHFEDLTNGYTAIFEFDSKPPCIKDVSPEPVEPRKCIESIQSINSVANNIVTNLDGDMPTSTQGNVHECLTDSFGNEYCPAQLSACGQEWDYSPGYSEEKQGTSEDFKSKITNTFYVYPEIGNKCDNYNVGCSGTNAFAWNKPDSFPLQDLLNKFSPIKIYKDGTYAGAINSYGEVTSIYNDCDGYGIKFGGNTVGCFDGKCNRGSGWSFCYTEICELVRFETHGGVGCEKGCIGYYCKNSNTITCPAGSSIVNFENGAKGCASTSTKCPDGYKETGSSGNKACKNTFNYTYYNYFCETTKNMQGYGWQGPLISKGGDCSNPKKGESCNSKNPPSNNCRREKYICKVASDRPCVKVNNSWKCSPFPCFGTDDFENIDTKAGSTDSKNKGFDTDGNCIGQIRIFNGTDRRCNSKYTFNPWKKCCAGDDGILGFISKCNPEEEQLAKYLKKTKNQAHYIGEYCAEKLKFPKICIRKKKTYCTFGSVLGRIINEQGRIQLNRGWGSPEKPDCKGFTPEEFQKINFDKIDMTEFTNDITEKVTKEVANKISTTLPSIVDSKINAMYGGNKANTTLPNTKPTGK